MEKMSTWSISFFGSADPHAYGIGYVPVANVMTVPFVGDPVTELTKEKRILFAISATRS